jgi:hypothetical protein
MGVTFYECLGIPQPVGIRSENFEILAGFGNLTVRSVLTAKHFFPGMFPKTKIKWVKSKQKDMMRKYGYASEITLNVNKHLRPPVDAHFSLRWSKSRPIGPNEEDIVT